jgi:hypothetical protein
LIWEISIRPQKNLGLSVVWDILKCYNA